MALTIPTQIRIEDETKKQASKVLDGLGLNLSGAVNIFLKQVILQNGIPFEVKYPEHKAKEKDAKQAVAGHLNRPSENN